MTSVAIPPPNRLDEANDRAQYLLFNTSPQATQDWIEEYLTVPNEHGQIVKMKLYPQQIQMLVDETGRDVTVKGRQTRASSLKIARNLRRLVTGQLWGATFVVGAQDDQTTQGVFRKRFEHHLRDLASAGYKFQLKANEQELVITELDNRIVWVSGEQRTMSRGFAAQGIHFSEFAHWKDSALELIGGAIPAVPSSGTIDLESTPKGEQGAFYEYAMRRAKPNNPNGLWACHLYPWWMEPRYRVDDDLATGHDLIMARAELADRERLFVPSEYEAGLMDKYGLEIRQILWRRLKKEELDATNAPFLQEYPEDLDTCWLGTEGKFFDTPDGIDHLEWYRDHREEPKRRFEHLPYRGDMVSFYGPNLGIWEFPDSEDTYVGGFDAAGGGVGKNADFSVAYVMSARQSKVVASLRVQASPKVFATMLCALGNFYKTATFSGERSHQGDVVFSEMRDLGYANIYYHVDTSKPKDRPQMGLYPSSQNRQMVLDKFKAAIVGQGLESSDPNLVREMNVFTWQKFKDRMKASALDLVGMHDDCIFAAAHCWFIIDKVRNRLRRQVEDIIITTQSGRVISRGGYDETARSDQVWFT